MSISRTLFGQTRTVPEFEEENWGPEVTDYDSDLITGVDALAMRTAAGDVFPRRRSIATTVIASDTLDPTGSTHVLTAASAVTLDATTAIADGEEDGQELRLEGTSDTNTVTVLDGANTDLNGPVILGNGETIDLVWRSGASVWREVARNH